MSFIRSPIICILGHVDHGKTSLLDAIRGTGVAKKEAGGITQMIGASYVSKEDIDRVAGKLAERMKLTLKIPGLLFIDTPGHEAFSSLRDRGGSIADLVVLVVDVNQGFQPQTIESIKILKQYKTPFLIAANKIDAISGWRTNNTKSFMESFNDQAEHVKEKAEEKIYQIMGHISEHGFDSERFDRVKDFTKQIGIIPISAKTQEGLGELLVLIAGLSQRFLEGSLDIDEKGRGKASVMEVKDEKGLGTVVDVIVYDGVFNKNDDIAFLTVGGVKRTKIRGLLLPNLSGKDKYQYVDSVVAAAGVRIYAPDLEGAIPGSPLDVIHNFEEDKKDIEEQLKSAVFVQDEVGVILRADSLGSVEALLKLLKVEGIKVRDASVGHITRKEVISAGVVAKEDPYMGIVLAFNVRVLDEAQVESDNTKIPIINRNIIYKLIDDYKDWVKSEKDRKKKESIQKITCPGKIKALPGFFFRASKPAIFGVDVLAGRLKKNYRLMNESGEIVGEVREIQKDKEKVEEAGTGDQLAISCDGIILHKNVTEGELLYTYMTEDEMKKWDSQLQMLSKEEKEVFEKIKKLLRIQF
ncbi:translation initiation factor IF-2 [Candidatus Micrarchaeota archaeon]|nr:translation initiation factor IF-2 [Candidatus Micrarchaeota archaeon]